MTRKTRSMSDDRWLRTTFVFHVGLIKSMLFTLKRPYRMELMDHIRYLISDGGKSEVKFSNPAVTALAKCILTIYCDEWYSTPPEITMVRGGFVLHIDWLGSINKSDE